MKNVSLPAPPTASWEKSGAEKTTGSVSTAPKMQPLDAAFLGRLYRTVCWCGALGAVMVYLGFSSYGATVAMKWTASFCGWRADWRTAIEIAGSRGFERAAMDAGKESDQQSRLEADVAFGALEVLAGNDCVGSDD